MARRFLLPTLALLALLAGCDHATPPTPMPQLPTLERPVARVHHDSTRGNVTIPREALVTRGGIPGVFVLGDDNQARFRMVRPGPARGNQTVILSGLQGGETLVLGDLAPVHDGSPIRPKK